MFRRVLSLGVPTAAIVTSLVGACADTTEVPRVSVATNLALPKGVLDRVSKLTLTVLEGSVTCDAAAGQTAFPDGVTGAKEIARRDLDKSGCTPGVRFCGDLTIDKSDAMRVFSAVAKSDRDAPLAIGCTAIKVNQDSLPVAIKMFRFIEPSICGDSILQPLEQCDPGGTPICDATCMTKELLLSVGSTQTGTTTGGPGDKMDPSLLWPQQSGLQGRFFAFYTDHAGTGGKNKIALRAMRDDLSPIDAGESPALSAGSIYLPNGPTFPPPPPPFTQSAPQAAFLKGKYYVVFEDDNTPPAFPGVDIHLRSMDGALVAEQGATALGINGGPAGTGGMSGQGEVLIQSKPVIAAGPKDRLFIAWEDATGKIAGRTLSPPATLGNQNDISIGNGNKGVSLAATSTGWVAVWQGGTGIKLRVLNEDGTPQGSDQPVNDSGSVNERPRVASLADGRFAVTWNAGGDIFMQRYDVKGSKIAGDQAAAINDVVKDGDQTTPSIAGTPAAGGSYVVVWLDTVSNNIQGRMLGGSAGFLFNNVNGQSTEFQASRPVAETRVRANPTVAAGGSTPFIGVVWEDKSARGAGIVARRFPLPNE